MPFSDDYDGAIGSRFTQESIMISHLFPKIISNRAFHLLARVALRLRFHDISNNLKLYRSEVLKSIEIDQGHFAANAETGLKPWLPATASRKYLFRGLTAPWK